MPQWLSFAATSEFWTEALVTVLILFAAWVGSRVFLLLVDRVGRRWAARTGSRLDDVIIEVVRRPGSILVFLIGVYSASHRYQFRLQALFDGVLFALTVSVFVFGAVRVIAALLRWYGERLSADREGETVRRQLLPFADKLIRIVLVIIGLMVILEHFHIPVQSMLVSLGVGSLAVGLALQDTLANMFGGFTIMLDRPFRTGDRIQLQTGELGDVESIGMRSTTLLMPDGNSLVVPNALLVKNMVVNYSLPSARARVMVELGVDYGTDTERAKALLLECARGDSRIVDDPPPSAFFKAFGDSALRVVLVCYVKHFLDVMPVTDAINTQVNDRFRSAGIRIPFPTRSLFVEGKLPG